MRAPAIVRLVARMLLRLQPRSLRREFGGAFLEAAEHRWRRERGRSVIPALRTVVALLADAVRSVPANRWRTVRMGDASEGAGRSRAVHSWTSDLRVAGRTLARRPAYLSFVVATLGLGIGVAAAIFSALDRVVLRALPFEEADRLAYVAIRYPRFNGVTAPDPELLERWRAGHSFAAFGAYGMRSLVYQTNGPEPEILNGIAMSPGLPRLLGVQPVLGRFFDEGDVRAEADQAIVISETFWRRALGSDPKVIGRDLRMNDRSMTVIGIWPDAARLPGQAIPDFIRTQPDEELFDTGFAHVVGRLAPGVNEVMATAELAAMSPVDAEATPTLLPASYFVGRNNVIGLWLIFGGGAVLLAVAFVTVAGLQLTRLSARSAEISVRRALGCSMGALVRIVVMEAALLTAAGSFIGIAVAAMVAAALGVFAPPGLIPDGGEGLDQRTFQFMAIVSVAILLFGTVVQLPWLRDRRAVGQITATTRVSRGVSPAHVTLVVLQSAVAVLLIAGAALMLRSVVRITTVDTGMAMEELVMVSLNAPAAIRDSDEAVEAWRAGLAEAIAGVPGVRGSTSVSFPLLSSSISTSTPWLIGELQPPDTGKVDYISMVSAEPNYFDVLGIPLLAGRTFESATETNAVIVNEAFARSRGGEVLGRQLRMGRDSVIRTIVGIAKNVSSLGLRTGTDLVQLYLPYDGSGSFQRFVIRTDRDPAVVLQAVRAGIAEVDPGNPLREATTGIEILRHATAGTRFLGLLIATFAVLGLAFAIGGVYGAVSLDTVRRTREVGIRIALGATSGLVRTAILRRGLLPVLLGGVIGTAAAMVIAPHVEAVLFRVPGRDPLSTGIAAAVLLATALVACLIPATRAARVDPAITLRAE